MNWYSYFQKVKNFIKEYYWIAGAPFLIWGLFATLAEREDIEKNRSETYGAIYSSTPVYKKASKRNFRYKFNYDGIEYYGSSTGSWLDGIEIGKIYKVKFSNQNPKHSKMDFEIEYSKKVVENEDGQMDTIFIPTSEMKLEIPEDLKDRLKKLKNGTEIKN